MSNKPASYLNRELSWLQFNKRVLEEAKDPSVPLLDRMMFLSITSSNLDEFFMVRVGGMEMLKRNKVFRKDPSGMTPAQQRDAMVREAGMLMAEQYSCISALLNAAGNHGIKRVLPSDISENQFSFLESYFLEHLFPVLSPMQAPSDGHPSLIQNLRLHVCVRLKGDDGEEDVYAYIPIQGGISRIVYLPGEGMPFIMVEDVIGIFINRFFVGKNILESAVFRVTRNADMTVKDELATDFLAEMEEAVRQRKEGHFVRLELNKIVSKPMESFLRGMYSVESGAFFVHNGPLDLGAFNALVGLEGYETLKSPRWLPQQGLDLRDIEDIFSEIRKGDILLFHPFESFDPVVEFVRAASEDPAVLAIKQILYRTSSNSPIVEALRKAAESGKHVTVLVELKARFDESRNIEWARELERSGVQVIYGMKGLKTHAKICIVVRREQSGIRRYMHFGTGNYNEKTARLYTDIGLLTCDEDLGADSSAFFNVITGYSEPKGFLKLVSAPSGLKERIIDLIAAEGERSRLGQAAWIKAKMNSLADPDVIDALYKASNAGVKIFLNVRGICCLKPGVPGMSENIIVKSIVDRFLEHSRIFCFHAGGRDDLFISSADWMPRNLSRRIELMIPVQDKKCRKKLLKILNTCLADNEKGALLQSDGNYKREAGVVRRKKVRSQAVFCQEAVESASMRAADNTRVFQPHVP